MTADEACTRGWLAALADAMHDTDNEHRKTKLREILEHFACDRPEAGASAVLDLVEGVETAIRSGDWKVDGACDPEAALARVKRHFMNSVREPEPDRRTIICPVEGVCDDDDCRRTQKCKRHSAASVPSKEK